MFRLHGSIAAKLVLGYGLLGMASMVAVSAVFYIGTIGVLDQNIDGKIVTLSDRLLEQRQSPQAIELVREVNRLLGDGIDSDREIFLVTSADGRRMAGNLTSWPKAGAGDDELLTGDVVRDGVATRARLYLRPLADGGMLVVGRDLSEQEAIRSLVWRSLATGAGVSLLLTVLGAALFRQQIEMRLGAIRRTAELIEAGDMSRRIPVGGDDEFSQLNRDINRMLDRIELLMDGIRHVSNAIAHDLRTPLSRIRSKLDEAVRHPSVEVLGCAAHDAIDHIDDLIRLFERLLQIAEAESGVRAQLFESVDLNRIAEDMADMYDASAEELNVRLTLVLSPGVTVQGDRNLLASAVASLLDNALKYAGAGASIELRTARGAGTVSIAVCDNGPGIPEQERGKVTQRFYRLDKSRNLPGNGLGLSIVGATATLHDGVLALEDGAPGLIARITLPVATEITGA